jgi:large repetitive protein
MVVRFARRGLVIVSLVSLAVVGVAGEAGATDNPIVGTSECTFSGPPTSPLPSCTFTGTVDGTPYTGNFDNASITYNIVQACSPSGDLHAGEYDGTYTIAGGAGIFAGVTGSGPFSQSATHSVGFPELVHEQRYGGAPSCGSFPVIADQELPDATIGQPYSATLSASGGTQPYHWRRIGKLGKLPRGLKFDKSTQSIAGTPKKRTGTFTFTIEVKDSNSPKRSGTHEFSITVH